SPTPYGSFFETGGQMLANGTLEYKQGMLKSYNIGCAVSKEVADFPMKATNCNEVCYLCYDICQEEIKHPDHEMEESIIVDGKRVKYYEDGLGCDSKAESLKMKLECGALQYKVTLDGIPTASITENNGNDLIDSEYSGKMLFMGSNDYYVNDLDKNFVILAKGEELQISSAGYTEPTLPELQGYRFKLLKVIMSGDKVAGVSIEVEKPDGTTSEVQALKSRNALLGKDEKGHQVEIRAFEVTGDTAKIIAYDMSTQQKLEHNKKMGDWRVNIDRKKCNEVDVDDYKDLTNGNADKRWCLTELTLAYEGDITLGVGDTVYFPTNAVKFSFEGFKDEDFGDVKCSGGEDKIKIVTEGDHKVKLSFTTREGQRMEDVRLDEGPYNVEDYFLIGNTVYQFKGADESDNRDYLTLHLRDVSNANDFDVKIYPYNGSFAGFDYVKFKDDDTNKQHPCIGDPCKTYNGTVLGVMAYHHSAMLWMDRNNDNIIGLNDIDLTDIQNDNCP
ncbi:MAG: hypothetical protein K6348_01495, partial [Deferribacterales bacterium]